MHIKARLGGWGAPRRGAGDRNIGFDVVRGGGGYSLFSQVLIYTLVCNCPGFTLSLCSIVIQCLSVDKKIVGSNPVKDYILLNLKNQNSRYFSQFWLFGGRIRTLKLFSLLE